MSQAWVAADQRILHKVAATLSWQGLDYQGIANDPGTVTVDIAKADGTAVVTGGATSGTTTAPRTYSLSAANNLTMEWLTATWKVASVTVATTLVESVGGYWASVAEIRAADASLADVSKYPNATVVAIRDRAEREAEEVLGFACTPRYARIRVDGTGTERLVLPCGWLRSVRSVRVYSNGTSYSSFSSDDIAAIPADEAGVAVRVGGGVWEAGRQNIVIEFEHGRDRPPGDLLHWWFMRVRSLLNTSRSGIPDRATSFIMDGGGAFSLATPGKGGSITGLPDYDRLLAQHSIRYGIA